MPTLSLTDLVDVVSKSGTPKATKVATIKARPDYEPAFDFYKPLREAIVKLHQKSAPRSTLDDVLKAVHVTKQDNYPEAIAGYKKFLGKKHPTWFEPARTEFSSSGIDVIVNPELGLGFGDAKHLVKLYFKAEPLTKPRVAVITGIMHAALGPKVATGVQMSVIDVRRGKLFSGLPPDSRLTATIGAELAYISYIWPLV